MHARFVPFAGVTGSSSTMLYEIWCTTPKWEAPVTTIMDIEWPCLIRERVVSLSRTRLEQTLKWLRTVACSDFVFDIREKTLPGEVKTKYSSQK